MGQSDTDGCTDGRKMDGWIDRWTDGGADRQTDRQTNGRTDGRTDGRKEGRTERRTKGQAERHPFVFSSSAKSANALPKPTAKFNDLLAIQTGSAQQTPNDPGIVTCAHGMNAKCKSVQKCMCVRTEKMGREPRRCMSVCVCAHRSCACAI